MNDEEIGSYLNKKDFNYFLDAALEKVPDGIDTREGSIIYDALAPACYELAEMIFDLKNILLETFVQTATGKYLDYRAEEAGISRFLASQAIVRGRFLSSDNLPFSLAVGNRFSSIGENPVYYSVIAQENESGNYRLRAEVTGTRGNEYVGQLLPVDNFNNLGEATLSEILIPARDTESDDDLRERIIDSREVVSFGGNVSDYIGLTMNLEGVGAVQVYPTWQGGGTVRLVILGNNYLTASSTLVEQVQQIIDPTQDGLGIGYAPIGHVVTIAAPSERRINISFKLGLNAGVTIGQVRENVLKVIESHFNQVRKNWGERSETGYDCWLYRSQLSAAILTVIGVANVQEMLFDGQDSDIQMELSNQEQELPLVGEVTIL